MPANELKPCPFCGMRENGNVSCSTASKFSGGKSSACRADHVARLVTMTML